jgi:hypothetical protein
MQEEIDIEQECLIFERKILKDGYVKLKIDGKWCFEHRYILSKFLNREISENEVIHHKNHNPQDNRICNLQILSIKEHERLHKKEKIKGY